LFSCWALVFVGYSVEFEGDFKVCWKKMSPQSLGCFQLGLFILLFGPEIE